MTAVFIRDRRGRYKDTVGRRPHEEDRNWSDAVPRPGVPRLARSHHQLERGKDFFLEPSGEEWPLWHVDFRLLSFRTIKEQISVALSHTIYGTWLQQP